MESSEITLLETILHGGPIIILAYLVMTMSGLTLAFLVISGAIKRHGFDGSAILIPFPAVIGLTATAMTIVFSLPIRDMMSGLAEFGPLATDLGRSFMPTFFGGSISVSLYILAIAQLILNRK